MPIEIHPPLMPVSLENDWTAQLKEPPAAEKEVRKHEATLGPDGHLFTSIGAARLVASGVVKEDELRNILEPSGMSASCFQNEVAAVTNLFFSEDREKFYKFKEISQKPADILSFCSFLLILANIFNGLEKHLEICFQFKKLNKETVEELKMKIKEFMAERNINFDVRFMAERNINFDVSTTTEKLSNSAITANDQEQTRIKQILGKLIDACREDGCALKMHNKSVKLDKTHAAAPLIDKMGELIESFEKLRKPETLNLIPNKEQLLREIATREACPEGTLSPESRRKIRGEIEYFFNEVIDLLACKGLEGCTSVYSANVTMLKPFVSISKGKRYEIDWTLFTKSGVFFIEVSHANQQYSVSEAHVSKYFDIVSEIIGDIMLTIPITQCCSTDFRTSYKKKNVRLKPRYFLINPKLYFGPPSAYPY